MSVNLQSCLGFLVSRRIERRALSSQRSVKFNRSDQPPDTEHRVSINSCIRIYSVHQSNSHTHNVCSL